MSKWALDLVSGTDSSLSTANSTRAITGITKAANAVVTAVGHGLLTGDYVFFASVGGMTQMNSQSSLITYIDADHFSCDSINSSGYSTYTSGGTVAPSITRASTCKVTLPAHGFGDGQQVYVSSGSIAGMHQLNALVFTVRNPTTNTFELYDSTNTSPINSTSYSTFQSGGTWIRYNHVITGITKANPAVVTAPGHGRSNGDKVWFQVQGMTQLNDFVGTVANATTNTFEISGVDSSAFSTFTSGWCRRPYLNFNSLNGIPNGILNDNDEVVCGKTWTDDSSVDVGSGDIVFTKGNTVVTTSVDLRASLSAGNWIGKTGAVGTGCSVAGDPTVTAPEIFYKISSISATQIILTTKYAGASATVSSVSRLRLGTEVVQTGSASANAWSPTRSYSVVSGGWNLSGGTAVRDGETWICPVTTNADYHCMSSSSQGTIFEYLAFVGGYRGAYLAGTGSKIRYCYTNPLNYYGFYNGAVNTTIEYSTGVSNNVSYGIFYNTISVNSGGIIQYSMAVSTNTSFQGVSYSKHYKCYAPQGFYGFYASSGPGALFESCVADSCSYGVLRHQETQILNCTFTSCGYGVYNQTQQMGGRIKGCTFNSCTYGVYLTQTITYLMESNTFTSCGRDVFLDGYSARVKSYGHVSTTPTTWAYDVSSGTDLEVIGFSIDAPSLAKAFSSIRSNDSINLPSYTIMGCSQFADGQYFIDGSITKDTSEYYGSSPFSTKISISGLSTNSLRDLKLVPISVRSGHGGTFTYRVKRHASWTGTVTPKFYFNGIETTVGTAWTEADVNSSGYTLLTITIGNGSVTTDGVLMFALNWNATNYAVNIDFQNDCWVES